MSNNRALVSPVVKIESASAESGPFAKKGPASNTPSPLDPPTLLGRYALFGQIGAGGMGVVHLGRLLGSGGFERAVAIKRIHPTLINDDKFVTMFREELRLLARVRHQNVIAALDVLQVDDELLLVMDYVHGESLAALLQRSSEAGKTLPLELSVTIACGVLKGLHSAHVATDASGEPLGIIHRDVSPHNMLVGCDGFPRILDFGVAKSVGSRQLTRVGELRGKPGYVSPEQIRGEKLTARADVYSLSVVLWEMLAGRRLFGARPLAQAIEDILAGAIPPFGAVCEEPISANLEAIVRRGLSTSPDDRFESAREMALALEAEVRLVSPEVVGAWVESTASADLADRARQLAWCETCPLNEEEVTRICPPPQPDDTWLPRAKTPTPALAPRAAAARSVPPASSRRGRSPNSDPARSTLPEMITREVPLEQLVRARPVSRPRAVPPPPPPPAVVAAPAASSKRRHLSIAVVSVVALLAGASTLVGPADIARLFGARPQPAATNQVPTPGQPQTPPVSKSAAAQSSAQPSTFVKALPLLGSTRKAQPARPPAPPPKSTLTIKRPVARSPAPLPANPGLRKAVPAPVRRPAAAKAPSSPDGF